MKLYHGTYLDKLVEIIKDGVLDNTKVDCSTFEFDEMFEKYLGHNFTKNAIYLTDDIECAMYGYEYEFTIDTDSDFINTNYLYVADFDKREEINCAETEEEIINLIKEYKESFIPYNEYVNCYESYNETHTLREFLYFGKINVSNEVNDNKEDILARFEFDWVYDEDYKKLLGDYYN